MNNLFSSRRSFTFGLMAASLAGVVTAPTAALAFSASEAEALIQKTVAEINSIIASGSSKSVMLRNFKKVMTRYADMPSIARSSLGAPARTASSSELNAFTAAFTDYVGNKYGSRFREFEGGRIDVKKTRKINSIYEVQSTAVLRGQSPLTVTFIVSDRSGKFIDIQIEGISLLKSERSEIGARLDRAGGSISRLTQSLK